VCVCLFVCDRLEIERFIVCLPLSPCGSLDNEFMIAGLRGIRYEARAGAGVVLLTVWLRYSILFASGDSGVSADGNCPNNQVCGLRPLSRSSNVYISLSLSLTGPRPRATSQPLEALILAFSKPVPRRSVACLFAYFLCFSVVCVMCVCLFS